MGQGNYYQQPPPQQQQAPPPQYQQQPPAYYPPQHIGQRMEHASIGQRIAAILIDGIIIGIPIAILYVIIIFTMPSVATGMFSGAYIAMPVISVLLYLLYFVAMEGGSKSATIGKKVMKLKVVDEQYKPIGKGKAFVRNILRWIPVIGTIVFIVDLIFIITRDDKQSFRDTLAHTYVVRVNPQFAGQLSLVPQQYQQPYQQAPPPKKDMPTTSNNYDQKYNEDYAHIHEPNSHSSILKIDEGILHSMITLSVPEFILSNEVHSINVIIENKSDNPLIDFNLDFSEMAEFFEVLDEVIYSKLQPGMKIDRNIRIKAKIAEGDSIIAPVTIIINANGINIYKKYNIKVGGTEIY